MPSTCGSRRSKYGGSCDLVDTYLDDVVAGIEGSARTRCRRPRHGGPLVLKAAAERAGVAGLILVDAELPAELRPPRKPDVVREVPVAYGRAVIGWDASRRSSFSARVAT